VKFTLPGGYARRGAPLLCVLLAGCTGLLHSTAQPEQIYYLRAPPTASGAPGAASVAAVTATGASLRVATPLANPGFDSSRIMLVQADHRMNFYAGSRWPGTAPEVIGALTVETLRASGAWNWVQDSASAFPADYLLHITVRRFEADYSGGGGAPQVQVVLDCTLGRREGREVIASFVAQGAATAAADRMSEVVAAFEEATRTALQSLSQQASEAVRTHAPPAPPAPSER
jgi:cholesterol transport system auxiliary component